MKRKAVKFSWLKMHKILISKLLLNFLSKSICFEINIRDFMLSEELGIIEN